jgi:hypothetical protein
LKFSKGAGNNRAIFAAGNSLDIEAVLYTLSVQGYQINRALLNEGGVDVTAFHYKIIGS